METPLDLNQGSASKSEPPGGLAAQLEQCREQLRQERLRRQEFAAQLNQKLRTPLNAIMGFAELLQMKSGNDDDVQQILKAGRELLGLINVELTEFPEGDKTGPVPTNSQCDVLYIEDNRVNFMLVEHILQSRPALKLLQATRGETGVSLAAERTPRLILLDLNLPDIHGSDVLHRLQQDPATAQIPVVVISADATPSQIERLLAAGARNYLTKPFGLKQFLAVVDEVLEQANAAT